MAIHVGICNRPIKLSGNQSVLVYFDFNQQLVDLIKTYQPCIWHKNLGVWETSINNLAGLLDEFCKIDEIVMTIDNRDFRTFDYEPLTEDEIKQLGFKPYEHQIEGINFGLQHHKFLLLDNPGCGKTKSDYRISGNLEA